MKKSKSIVSLLSLLSVSIFGYADEQSERVDQLVDELNQLREETYQLKQQLVEMQDESSVDVSTDLSPDYRLGYVGVDSIVDDNDVQLLIDVADVNKDLLLLRQKEAMRNGRQLILSGNVATTLAWHSNSFGIEQDLTSATIADVDIDIGAFVTDDVLAFAKLAGSVSSSSSDAAFDQIFLTYGNLEKSPYYFTVGRVYLPSGDFGTVLITQTLARRVGRIRANSVLGGYAQNGIQAALFAFDGPARKGDSTSIDQWGANFQMDSSRYPNEFIDWKFGVSYVNNIASALDFGRLENGVTDQVERFVGAYNLRGALEWKDLEFGIEYVSAVSSFKTGTNELQYNGRGAKPRAIVYQSAYSLDGFRGKPSTIGVSYQTAKEAFWADGYPQKQYGVAYKTELTKYLVGGIEYIRKHDYSENVTGNNGLRGTGKRDNVLTTKFDLFF